MSERSKYSNHGHGASGIRTRMGREDRGRTGYTREHRDKQVGIIRVQERECINGTKCIAASTHTCIDECAMRKLITGGT